MSLAWVGMSMSAYSCVHSAIVKEASLTPIACSAFEQTDVYNVSY